MGPGFYSFPKDSRPLSTWLQDMQGHHLMNYRTTPGLPAAADIVIIVDGNDSSETLRRDMARRKIVVLEAREFCSGATGRNAGHCKPDQWRGFQEQALKILQNEQETWSSVVDYVRSNNVDCELWVGDTLDVPVTWESADDAKEIFERYKTAGGNFDHIKVTNDPVKARQVSRINGAKACYAWPASTVHPLKLAAHVMSENLKKGVNLQTRTTVTQVVESNKQLGKWTVKTARGDIECAQVVHATNAYSPALEPSLRGLIKPTPHMCSSRAPPVSFIGSKALQNSYGILLPGGESITINPRIPTHGPVLFWGSNPGQAEFYR
uniref:FAD dependent oxidoreductase domain-containing protein n=1 Tax=Bionectria ochroleuca TaxID=29856 RepID=A0A8H7K554_BIOOC